MVSLRYLKRVNKTMEYNINELQNTDLPIIVGGRRVIEFK